MSQTVNNLARAFVGESQARNRYTMYASIAKKEGYELIAATFRTTADQEHEHAKWLMRLINELRPDASEPLHLDAVEVPTVLGDTVANLKSAIAGENYEFESMYPEFAKAAVAEGHPKISTRLLAIAKAEQNHSGQYAELLRLIESGEMFKRAAPVVWTCRNCGHTYLGLAAPSECPACGHPQAYFEAKK